MSLGLWFFNWSWGSTSSASATSIDLGSGGGGSKADAFDYPINYEDLWAAREAYLRSLFGNPIKRQKALESEIDWPDPILKPRKKRT